MKNRGLTTARNVRNNLPPMSAEKFVRHVWKARGQSFTMPRTTDRRRKPLLVEAEHGRWIVKCLGCTGAELADPEDHRFFCLSCINEWANGKWVLVEWPSDREEIEIELGKRPERNRNWVPGETLERLRQENARHLGGK